MRVRTEVLAAVADQVLADHSDGLQYPDLADYCGFTMSQTQRAVRYLCANSPANIAVPTPSNGYRVVREDQPGYNTYKGIANQAKHLSSRIASQERRVIVAADTTAARSERKILTAHAKSLGGLGQVIDGTVEMFDAVAELRAELAP